MAWERGGGRGECCMAVSSTSDAIREDACEAEFRAASAVPALFFFLFLLSFVSLWITLPSPFSLVLMRALSSLSFLKKKKSKSRDSSNLTDADEGMQHCHVKVCPFDKALALWMESMIDCDFICDYKDYLLPEQKQQQQRAHVGLPENLDKNGYCVTKTHKPRGSARCSTCRAIPNVLPSGRKGCVLQSFFFWHSPC